MEKNGLFKLTALFVFVSLSKMGLHDDVEEMSCIIVMFICSRLVSCLLLAVQSASMEEMQLWLESEAEYSKESLTILFLPVTVCILFGSHTLIKIASQQVSSS